MTYLITNPTLAQLPEALACGHGVLLVGPSGCGKTTAIEAYAKDHDQALVTVTGHCDLSVHDLLGHYILNEKGSAFIKGPLLSAMEQGAIFYFDEIAGVSEGILKALYSLLDHRKQVYISGINQNATAHPDFRFVAAYNPSSYAPLPVAFRQRCEVLRCEYLSEHDEVHWLTVSTGIDNQLAQQLVAIAELSRNQDALDANQVISTRLLYNAAIAIKRGRAIEQAIETCLFNPLADDETSLEPLRMAAIAAGLLAHADDVFSHLPIDFVEQ